jgi:5'-phosphate synthase pdxT subunit
MKIGILALQGDFLAHGRMLERLGVEWCKVLKAEDFDGIDGLVIPGGESTTLLKLLDDAMKDGIRSLSRRGAIYGTCAGAILLAKATLNPEQEGLGLLDAVVIRNGYGRQNESFVFRPGEDDVEGEAAPDELVFIRAPLLRHLGPGVEVLAAVKGSPVYVRQGGILATTFHPELTRDTSVHRRFLDLAGSYGSARFSAEKG